jgi:hypothetical protein
MTVASGATNRPAMKRHDGRQMGKAARPCKSRVLGNNIRSDCGARYEGIPNVIRKRSKTDEMPPNAATREADAGVLGDLDGFGMTKGREAGTPAVAVNPREGTAQLANAIMSALRAGDLVAAHAAFKALEAFVGALGGSTQQVCQTLGLSGVAAMASPCAGVVTSSVEYGFWWSACARSNQLLMTSQLWGLGASTSFSVIVRTTRSRPCLPGTFCLPVRKRSGR